MFCLEIVNSRIVPWFSDSHIRSSVARIGARTSSCGSVATIFDFSWYPLGADDFADGAGTSARRGLRREFEMPLAADLN